MESDTMNDQLCPYANSAALLHLISELKLDNREKFGFWFLCLFGLGSIWFERNCVYINRRIQSYWSLSPNRTTIFQGKKETKQKFGVELLQSRVVRRADLPHLSQLCWSIQSPVSDARVPPELLSIAQMILFYYYYELIFANHNVGRTAHLNHFKTLLISPDGPLDISPLIVKGKMRKTCHIFRRIWWFHLEWISI